jgi:hypothetical protein
MEQMIVSSFGCAFGLSGTDPIGGLIAGTFKPIFFNKSFQQIYGEMIGVKPVIRDSSDI